MSSNRLLLIDGNSIANRAFYGIMNGKMLSANGIHTNAIYGFFAILFKEIEDLAPEYIGVTFDLKAPTHRHNLYAEYKGTRHGMPDELKEQMPVIKEILQAMNIKVLQKEGFEADDLLGTYSKKAEEENHLVTILSGDRDTFQLATNNITIRIPRTSGGRTTEFDYDREKILEEYGIEPKKLIEVKALMGDTSDNIPGVPGIGEKTALKMIVEYGDIDKLYEAVESDTSSLKGATLEKIKNNKDSAFLSRVLGTILLDAPMDETIDNLKVEPWNRKEVYNLFKELRLNKFIERFDLENDNANYETSNVEENKNEKVDLIKISNIIKEKSKIDVSSKEELDKILSEIKNNNEVFYYINKIDDEEKYFKDKENNNIFLNNRKYNLSNKFFENIFIYSLKDEKVYYIDFLKDINNEEQYNNVISFLKEIFENETIKKNGFKLKDEYVILKEYDIDFKNISFDLEIAAYNLNPTDKVVIENIIDKYLELDIDSFINKELRIDNKEQLEESNIGVQLNIFDLGKKKDQETRDLVAEANLYKNIVISYVVYLLKDRLLKDLENVNSLDLFNNIEMPLVEVLADMQYRGMYLDEVELNAFGDELKLELDRLTKEIYEIAGEEFNINSPKQLGVILFEKLGLYTKKKTKTGYPTDVDTLKKLRFASPIIDKILDYRTYAKLNSTYVEGLIPCINKDTKRIHSTFMQTITATGRISSTEPNLQNIPTRGELGKNIRKAFKPANGKIYVDADYSQIELRVLASISGDTKMKEAFFNNEDIHRQTASIVLSKNPEDVTKEERSAAKAVNFGIVYGISDYGLADQLGISNKEAKEYIANYLAKYSGIHNFMEEITKSAEEKGYVETLCHRRRYIEELSSNNYMIRQFGKRVAMNTPIQGTAADIMKIAMINVYKKLKEENLDANLVLQVHDELIIETSIKDEERAKEILKQEMENAYKLEVPLLVEVSSGNNWNELK